MFARIFVLTLPIMLMGCATLSNLSTTYSLSEDTHKAVIIIGVKPDDRFGVEEGKLVNGQFKYDPEATPILAVYPKDGYVVAEMDETDGNQVYALTNIKESVHIYRACGGKPVDTFTVEPGKIIYLGDFQFPTPPVGLSHMTSYDPGSAEKYIRKNYPKLSGAPFVTQRTIQRAEIGFWETDIQGLVSNCD